MERINNYKKFPSLVKKSGELKKSPSSFDEDLVPLNQSHLVDEWMFL